MMFLIKGDPVAKGRPRFSGYHAYTPKKTRDYEALVKQSYMGQCGNVITEKDVKITIIAYFSIPKSKSKKVKEQMATGEIRPSKKPDIDNVMKSILDGLNGVAFVDDKQVVEVHVEKWYSEDPRVFVEIEEI